MRFTLGMGGLLVILISVAFVSVRHQRAAQRAADYHPPAPWTPPPSASSTPLPPVRLSPTATLTREVTVKAHWSEGGFGHVAIWDVVLHNTGKTTTWSDLHYEATYAGESGKVLRRSSGEFNVVLKPGARRSITEWNDGYLPQGTTQAGLWLVSATYDRIP